MTKSNKAGKARNWQLFPRPVAVSELTAWAAPNQTPAKVGVYEVKPEYAAVHRVYSYWDGVAWSADGASPEHALSHHGYGRESQQVTWRGVSK